MKEFKGTKTELEPKFVSGVCIGIGTVGAFTMMTANTILPDTDEEYAEQKEDIESNMKLYASAPKLLEAGLELIEFAEKYLNGNSAMENSQAYENLKSAINKALL